MWKRDVFNLYKVFLSARLIIKKKATLANQL